MYTAIIIDDELLAQEILKKLIVKLLPNKFKKILTANSIDDAVSIMRENQIDLVFLDFYMPNEYGHKLYEYFDEVDFEVVFTTANPNYIFDAINKWGCFGYLMKPISMDELKLVLDRFDSKYKHRINNNEPELTIDLKEQSNDNEFKSILNKENNLLLFSSSNEIKFIKINDIIYCKADDNYCEIKTKTQAVIISKPLKDIEKIIDRNFFVRVNRSYLVNLNYVSRLDKKSNNLEITIDNSNSEQILIPVTSSGFKILSKATV
jgi:two-component system, LytTR family, response regulator